MTTILAFQSDSYELIFDHEGVSAILRYSRNRDGRGELVPYDTLHPQLQDQIYKRLKRELKHINDNSPQ